MHSSKSLQAQLIDGSYPIWVIFRSHYNFLSPCTCLPSAWNSPHLDCSVAMGTTPLLPSASSLQAISVRDLALRDGWPLYGTPNCFLGGLLCCCVVLPASMLAWLEPACLATTSPCLWHQGWQQRSSRQISPISDWQTWPCHMSFS